MFPCWRIFLLAGSATDERVQSSGELLDVKRFGQIIVRAKVEAVEPLVQSAAGGAENHRHCRMPLPQVTQDAQAVAARQHDVEDNGIVTSRRGERKTFVAVIAEIHDKTLRFESLSQQAAKLLVIFHHEDFHAASLMPPANGVERKFIKTF